MTAPPPNPALCVRGGLRRQLGAPPPGCGLLRRRTAARVPRQPLRAARSVLTALVLTRVAFARAAEGVHHQQQAVVGKVHKAGPERCDFLHLSLLSLP